MSKAHAPVELTGGGGFRLEDQIAALYLASMLAGAHPGGTDLGVVEGLAWQTGDLGWKLDDLAVALRRPGAGTLALSVKSDRQVTSGGFPEAFVTAAWEQWNLTDPRSPFEKGRDLLGLAVGKLAAGVADAWHGLLREARLNDAARLTSRYSSPKVSDEVGRRLLLSLVPAGSDDLEAAARLVPHIRLLFFDFAETGSRAESFGLWACQQALRSSSPVDAADLWKRLVELASEHRTAGGRLDLAGLVGRIRGSVALRDRPDHAAAWRVLDRRSADMASQVSGSVGGRVSLTRDAPVSALRSRIAEGSTIVLAGDGGSGKSAVAMRLAADKRVFARFLWLDAATLDCSSLHDCERNLGVEGPLSELLGATAASSSCVVFDGFENFSPRAAGRAREIIAWLGPVPTNRGWTVILTARPQAVPEARAALLQAGVAQDALATWYLEGPTDKEVRAVLATAPTLNASLMRRELRAALRNLKLLDWVIDVAQDIADEELRAWVGTTQVVDALWGRWVGTGAKAAARAAVMKKLGRIEGDGLLHGVGASELDAAESGVLTELEDRGLVWVRDERIWFRHDMLGDWARLRLLIEYAAQRPQALVDFAKRPRWHDAIRMYGQRLLETDIGAPARWSAAVDSVGGDDAPSVVARDMLLEGLFLTTESEALLGQAWGSLCASNGTLLRRLLNRFRFGATVADPRIALVSQDVAEQSRLAPHMRIPWWPLWPALLSTLHRHAQDVARWAPYEAADLCALWLRTMPLEAGSRAEAASIALTVGREVQAATGEELCFHDDAQQRTIYEAVLHAAPDLPEEVSALCLELARRRPESAAVVARAKAHAEHMQKEMAERLARLPREKRRLGLGSPMFPRGKLRKQFRDGPSRRVDGAFQDAVLNTQGLLSLAGSRPDVAAEVLLACSLEEPHHESNDHFDSMLDRFGVEEPRGWYPPMFFRGPWLSLLRQDHDLGIDVIVRLADQATQNWSRKMVPAKATPQVRGATRARVVLDGDTTEWVGHLEVFGWYRDRLSNAHLLASALMALERWCYEQLDLGRSLDTALARVLSTSRSAALLGVLVSVGLYRPALFGGVLAPLLSAWMLYEWNFRMALEGDYWQMGLFHWASGGERVFNMVRDWHAMPHRKSLFRDEAVRLVLSSGPARERFESIRVAWRRELDSGECPWPESLELLIARMDPANYTATRVDETHIQIGLEWPAHLRQRTEQSLARSAAGSRLLMFPHECRKLLDLGTTVGEAEGQRILEQVVEFDAMELEPGEETSVDRRADAVLGGIAVLLLLGQDFLDADRSTAEWCEARLERVLKNPPPRRSIDTPVSISTDQWHSFLADIAVGGLCEAPEDPSVRAIVAEATMSFWYATTGVALRAAHRHRDTLGVEFERLVNLSVLWAALRRIRTEFDPTRAEDEVWEGRRQRLIDAYVHKRVPDQMMDWERIGAVAARASLRLHRRRFPGYSPATEVIAREKTEKAVQKDMLALPAPRRRRPRGDPGFDTSLLEHAFSWISLPGPTWTRDQETAVLGWLHELLGVTIRMLPSPDEDVDEEVDGTPYKYDHSVLELAARAVATLSSDEQARSVYAPIFELGPRCHYWVENFLRDWTVGALRVASSADVFFSRWRQMMDLAAESPQWLPSNGQRHFRLREMWEHLMGMHLGASVVGVEDNRERFRALIPYYRRWADMFLDEDRSLRAYARLLLQPGASLLLRPSVPWLLRSAERVSPYEWARDPIAEEVARVLRLTWDRHSEAVGGDRELLESFSRLLNLLVTQQSPTAMELRDRVSRVVTLE